MISRRRRNSKTEYKDKYQSILGIVYKALLIFVLSTIGVISVFDGDADLNSYNNNKVSMVARWKRSQEDIGSLLPFTVFRKSYEKRGREFWKSIQSNFECPGHILRKVGNVGEAGYWMCGMKTLGQLEKEDKDNFHASPCVVYSTGSEMNSFFEVEMVALTNCSVRSYEPLSAEVDHPLGYFKSNVIVESFGIGSVNNDKMKTLKTLMESNGNKNWVDVVKLNVGEREDIVTLENIIEDLGGEQKLPIGQLLLRLNVTDWGKRSGYNSAARIQAAFENLEHNGMRLFYKQISPFEKDSVADFSFINTQALPLFLETEDLEKIQLATEKAKRTKIH